MNLRRLSAAALLAVSVSTPAFASGVVVAPVVPVAPLLGSPDPVIPALPDLSRDPIRVSLIRPGDLRELVSPPSQLQVRRVDVAVDGLYAPATTVITAAPATRVTGLDLDAAFRVNSTATLPVAEVYVGRVLERGQLVTVRIAYDMDGSVVERTVVVPVR